MTAFNSEFCYNTKQSSGVLENAEEKEFSSVSRIFTNVFIDKKVISKKSLKIA